MITETDVLNGQALSPNNKSDILYKGVFEGKNLYIYRRVFAGDTYRGEAHKKDGYLLAWTDILEYVGEMPPSFVPLRALGGI